MTMHRGPDEGVVSEGERFSIANEFCGAWIRKVWTRNGERLELSIPKTGARAYLDATQLEILAGQSSKMMSMFNTMALESAQDASQQD